MGTFQMATVNYERLDDGTWRATYEDYYSDSGYGDTMYEALENLVMRIEHLFDEEESEG